MFVLSFCSIIIPNFCVVFFPYVIYMQITHQSVFDYPFLI